MARSDLDTLARSLGVVMDVQSHGLKTEKWAPGGDAWRDANGRDWDHYAYTITLSRLTQEGPYRFTVPYKMGTGLKGGPTLADVLYSVLSDGDSGGWDFEGFCAEFGYDEDSRRAHAAWQACRATADHLTRMFSDAELEALRLAAEGM